MEYKEARKLEQRSHGGKRKSGPRERTELISPLNTGKGSNACRAHIEDLHKTRTHLERKSWVRRD